MELVGKRGRGWEGTAGSCLHTVDMKSQKKNTKPSVMAREHAVSLVTGIHVCVQGLYSLCLFLVPQCIGKGEFCQFVSSHFGLPFPINYTMSITRHYHGIPMGKMGITNSRCTDANPQPLLPRPLKCRLFQQSSNLLSTRFRRVSEAKLQQSAIYFVDLDCAFAVACGLRTQIGEFLNPPADSGSIYSFTHEKPRMQTDADRILQFPWEHLIFSAGRQTALLLTPVLSVCLSVCLSYS